MEVLFNGSSPDECDIQRIIFFGMCYYCSTTGSEEKPLKRCSGCQLVAYCSKVCQKCHWINHKYVCKEFPIVGGKNVLHTTGSWEDHVTGLYDRAAKLEHVHPSPKARLILSVEKPYILFRNPRVCHTCHESNPVRLTNCKCNSVSYCSKKCEETDKPHKDACRLLGQIEHSYFRFGAEEDRPQATELVEMIKTIWLGIKVVCKLLGKLLGPNQITLPEVTTLNIHLVTKTPLFYPDAWDHFIHLFPKLKQLNLVFVMQTNASKSSINLNYKLSSLSRPERRCEECAAKNIVITYSVQQMLYHMYFSSPQYTVPDAVVVYGNTAEMSLRDEDDINYQISYRNMLHSQHTILILTDESQDLVQKGIIAVGAAQPVEMLGPPVLNTLEGLDCVKCGYIACLKRSPDSLYHYNSPL